ATNEVPFIATSPVTVSRGYRRKVALISVRKEPLTNELIRASARPLSQINLGARLTAEPEQIHLSADAPRHGVLITAHTTDGFEVDVTGRVKFSTSRRAPFSVDQSGEIHASQPGEGTLMGSF